MCTQYSFLDQQLDNNVRIINNYCLYFVLIYMNEDLKPQVKIGTSSGHVFLNEMQWFILVTFKSNIPKNEVHELGDPIIPCQCTLDGMYALRVRTLMYIYVKKFGHD